jgi:hypothetical protein
MLVMVPFNLIFSAKGVIRLSVTVTFIQKKKKVLLLHLKGIQTFKAVIL